MNQYEVVEGHVFVVNAVEFTGGEIVELTDEQAAEALKLGHVVRVEAVEAPVIAVDPALEGAEATVETVVEDAQIGGVDLGAAGTGVGPQADSQMPGAQQAA